MIMGNQPMGEVILLQKHQQKWISIQLQDTTITWHVCEQNLLKSLLSLRPTGQLFNQLTTVSGDVTRVAYNMSEHYYHWSNEHEIHSSRIL